jgi:hypothetical protein
VQFLLLPTLLSKCFWMFWITWTMYFFNPDVTSLKQSSSVRDRAFSLVWGPCKHSKQDMVLLSLPSPWLQMMFGKHSTALCIYLHTQKAVLTNHMVQRRKFRFSEVTKAFRLLNRWKNWNSTYIHQFMHFLTIAWGKLIQLCLFVCLCFFGWFQKREKPILE